jgi:FkbM family methyltransferase
MDITGTMARLRGKPRRGEAAGDDGARQVGSQLIGQSSSVRAFLEAYFGSSERKRVVQVGANDGVMCDPLRPYLSGSPRIEALLVEPIPYYFEKLRSLYRDYPNITLLNAACASAQGRSTLYFIEPEVADEMDGTGPANRWAHGQGSFDRNVVAYWIERNRFRGDDYVRNLGRYHAAIRSFEVNMVRLADIEFARTNNNMLLVIDVQGFELEVLRGIDWNHPPAYIMLEDDLNKSGPIEEYLGSNGYIYLCGRNDKVYNFRG